VQVLEEHIRALWSDGQHLIDRVAIASIRRIRVEPEPASPFATDPDLVGAEEIGDMVVLDSG